MWMLTQNPIISCLIEIQNVCTFPAYPECPEIADKQMFVVCLCPGHGATVSQQHSPQDSCPIPGAIDIESVGPNVEGMILPQTIFVSTYFQILFGPTSGFNGSVLNIPAT